MSASAYGKCMHFETCSMDLVEKKINPITATQRAESTSPGRGRREGWRRWRRWSRRSRTWAAAPPPTPRAAAPAPARPPETRIRRHRRRTRRAWRWHSRRTAGMRSRRRRLRRWRDPWNPSPGGARRENGKGGSKRRDGRAPPRLWARIVFASRAMAAYTLSWSDLSLSLSLFSPSIATHWGDVSCWQAWRASVKANFPV